MSSAASTLERWQADDERLRALHAQREYAPLPAASSRDRAGLDVLRDMVAGALPAPPIARTLDFILVHAEPGVAVFQGRPSADFLNPLGGLHGGWYATLLDSCVGCAVHTLVPAGRGYTTLELKVNLVRAVTLDVPLVRAEGRVVHPGRQVATAEGRLVGADGRLYAHATTTCLLFDTPSTR
jgi:uncharacterized protein (TIGR00369 family)